MRHYQSEPIKIGKNLWRIAVEDSTYLGRVTVYEWIRSSPFPEDMREWNWKNYQDWPSFNGNDTYGGMPKSLRKLWEKNEKIIEKHLQEVAA